MRPEKESMMNELRKRATDSVFVILTDPTKLDVESDQALRAELRKVDAEFHVVKNRLLGHVAPDLGVTELSKVTGPTAMVTGTGDVSETAKVLRTFIKARGLPVLKMGALEGSFLTKEDIEELADLPSREVMLAQVVGAVSAPLSEFVGVMNNMLSGFVNVLNALEEKKSEA